LPHNRSKSQKVVGVIQNGDIPTILMDILANREGKKGKGQLSKN
jgi:hypothetical protein